MAVITLCNQKGGVAKTTTAINLAAGLALAEFHSQPKKPARVLLVDMDPQGNSSLIISKGLFATNSTPSFIPASGKSLANLLIDDDPPLTIDVILPARIPTIIPKTNLDFIYVDIPAINDAREKLKTADAREFRLSYGINQVKSLYKYIVIDTGPGYGEMLHNALTVADYSIIPVECTGLGLNSIKDTLATIRLVQRRLNPSLQLLGILPTRLDVRRSEARVVLETLQKTYPELMFEPIRERAELSVANTEGLDIFSYRPPRFQSESYVSVAQSAQEYARFVADVIRRIGSA